LSDLRDTGVLEAAFAENLDNGLDDGLSFSNLF
jgi:hypothetical protein